MLNLRENSVIYHKKIEKEFNFLFLVQKHFVAYEVSSVELIKTSCC